MIARLWATQIEHGLRTFQQVPARLKGAVREILIANGHEDLIS